MKLTPLWRLVIVVGIQVLILLSLIGFRQYTLLTRDTVMLVALSQDTSARAPEGTIVVRYEISRIDLDDVEGDDELWDIAFVELREGSDGYWHAVAIHGDHDHEFEDTVVIKGDIVGGPTPTGRTVTLEYGIERIDIDGDAGAIPWDDRTISVEVLVDRFGNADARDLFADGVEFEP